MAMWSTVLAHSEHTVKSTRDGGGGGGGGRGSSGEMRIVGHM